MKFNWEAKDVVCGRMVCKDFELPFKSTGWTASWTFKIGWLAIGNPERPTDPKNKETVRATRADYCLISMTDGMISVPCTKQELADILNRDEMRPMPHEWLLATMNYVRHVNEHGNTL